MHNIGADSTDERITLKDVTTRRSFLSTATTMGVIAALGTPWAAEAIATTKAAQRNRSKRMLGPRWEIEAVREVQQFGDGTELPFFRFRSLGNTPSNGIVPLLRTVERRRVRLLITNTLEFPIQPMIVDHATGPVVNPGEKQNWSFRMPQAGTWLLTDALLEQASGPVGFGGVVIATPRPTAFSQLSNYGSKYDHEYTLMYQDADDRWNMAIDAGLEPDLSIYESNYHILNGLTFPNTLDDPDTLVGCTLGDQVLIRLANLGHVRHAIHFHGYHVDVLTQNHVPETALGQKDTIQLPGYSTTDVVLTVNQSGLFPIHPHSLTTVTDNGTYPFGQITLIAAGE